MKKENLFYSAIVFITVGFCLTGIGVGKLLDKSCIGAIIGLGIGLIASSLFIFKTVRRMDIYDRK